MVFNPLFLQNPAGVENIHPEKVTKLNNSGYLFSDIINVFMNNDESDSLSKLTQDFLGSAQIKETSGKPVILSLLGEASMPITDPSKNLKLKIEDLLPNEFNKKLVNIENTSNKNIVEKSLTADQSQLEQILTTINNLFNTGKNQTENSGIDLTEAGELLENSDGIFLIIETQNKIFNINIAKQESENSADANTEETDAESLYKIKFTQFNEKSLLNSQESGLLALNNVQNNSQLTFLPFESDLASENILESSPVKLKYFTYQNQGNEKALRPSPDNKIADLVNPENKLNERNAAQNTSQKSLNINSEIIIKTEPGKNDSVKIDTVEPGKIDQSKIISAINTEVDKVNLKGKETSNNPAENKIVGINNKSPEKTIVSGLNKPEQATAADQIKVTEQIKTPEQGKATEQIKVTEQIKTPEQGKASEQIKVTEPIKTPEQGKATEQIKVTEPIKTPEQLKTSEQVKIDAQKDKNEHKLSNELSAKDNKPELSTNKNLTNQQDKTASDFKEIVNKSIVRENVKSEINEINHDESEIKRSPINVAEKITTEKFDDKNTREPEVKSFEKYALESKENEQLNIKVNKAVKHITTIKSENSQIQNPDKPVKENSEVKTNIAEEKTKNIQSGESNEKNFSQNENSFKQSEENKHVPLESSKISSTQVKEKFTLDAPLPNSNSERIVKAAEIMKEISKFIEKQDKSTLTLKVSPENLGRLKITLDITDQNVKANIHVENEAVKSIIEKNIADLQNQMSKNGIQLTSVNISLSDNEQKNTKQFVNKKKNNGFDSNEKNVEEIDEDKVKMMGYNTVEYLA